MRISTAAAAAAAAAATALPLASASLHQRDVKGNTMELDVDDKDTITAAAKSVADSLVKTYYADAGKPGSVPGILPAPYYWWESGLVLDGLVNYWQLTGDDAHNPLVQEALVWQLGDDDDYMPANQTRSLGNDDQLTWALAAMTAAERQFPTRADTPSWERIAANVFDEAVARWDNSSCGGGLRWQIYPFNAGYNYKNTLTQGLFVQLAARLAHFTNNHTYADWAEKAYQWTLDAGLIDETDYHVYDGADVTKNCSAKGVNHLEWSNTATAFLYGAAVMNNVTSARSDSTWRSRTDGHLKAITNVFFSPSNTSSSIEEIACDRKDVCNADQRAYKAQALRYLALTGAMAPWTSETITPRLRVTAQAAAERCNEDSSANATYVCESLHVEGKTGLGEQLVALDAVMALLVEGEGAGAQLGTANGTSAARNGTATSADGTAASSASASAEAGASNAAGAGRGVAMGAVVVGLLGFWLGGL